MLQTDRSSVGCDDRTGENEGGIDRPHSAITTPALWVLGAVTLTMAVGNMGLASIMPAIGRKIGMPDFLVAAIFSLSALLWTIMSPFWARMSDRHGRRRFIVVGLSGFIFSMMGCGLVVLIGLQGIVLPIVIFGAFFIVRSSYGLLGPASAIASQTYIADRTIGRERVRAMAMLGGALSCGTIVGPAIAPFLIVGPPGLASPLFFFALFGLGVLGAVLWVIPCDRRSVATSEMHVHPPRAGGIWSNPIVRPFLNYGIVMCCVQGAGIYVLGFRIIDLLKLPPAEAQAYIGITMSIGAVTSLIAQWGGLGFAGISLKKALQVGAVAAVVGNLCLAGATGITSTIVGFAVANFGYGLARPSFSAGASLAASPLEQGAVSAAVSSIAGASMIVAPIVSVLFYEWNPVIPFLLMAASVFALAIYAFRNRALRSVSG